MREISLEQTEPAGGWDAEQARGYLDFAIREEISRYVQLYGWDALDEQVETVRDGAHADHDN